MLSLSATDKVFVSSRAKLYYIYAWTVGCLSTLISGSIQIFLNLSFLSVFRLYLNFLLERVTRDTLRMCCLLILYEFTCHFTNF